MSKKTPETRLATHTNEELYYRDDGLVSELMGNFTFTEMMFMHILGRKPSSGDVVILDAVLLTLMEHGFNTKRDLDASDVSFSARGVTVSRCSRVVKCRIAVHWHIRECIDVADGITERCG